MDTQPHAFESLASGVLENLGIDLSPSQLESMIYARSSYDDMDKLKMVLPIYAKEGLTIDTPFIRGTVASSHKEEFVLANYLYPGDEHGMSVQQILQSPFVYLTHASHLEYVREILDSGFIKPVHRIYDKDDSHFPGVYCYPNMHRDPYKNMGLEVIYVLSLALLRKRAWHINRDEDYGNVSSMTWDYVTLPQHLSGDYVERHGFEEIVFHDKIPISYVSAIVVKDKNAAQSVRRLLRGKVIPVITIDEWKAGLVYKLIKGISSEGSYTNDLPNFCYDNMGGGDMKFLRLSNIRCTLLNSGLPISEVEEICKMKRKDLLAFMYDLWTSRLARGEKHPPLVHPPY